ncbi:MAG: hypothetical protein R3C60_01340 [Parvularculaceae bacterium]
MKFTKLTGAIAAMAAAAGLAFAGPAYAKKDSDHDHNLNIHIGKDKDLLPQLIDMDAEDIADMKEEFADARADIDDAIDDIADAREEAKAAPGGSFFVKIAFAAASSATDAAANAALDEVFDALDRAERDLKTADVSADERVETQLAIDTLRTELASLRAKLGELVDAMRT